MACTAGNTTIGVTPGDRDDGGQGSAYDSESVASSVVWKAVLNIKGV